jgi:hypothetical protein
MMISILWGITPCGLFEVNRRFGGIYRLHLRGRKISRARNQHEPGTDRIENVSYIIACSRCRGNIVFTELSPSNGCCTWRSVLWKAVSGLKFVLVRLDSLPSIYSEDKKIQFFILILWWRYSNPLPRGVIDPLKPQVRLNNIEKFSSYPPENTLPQPNNAIHRQFL